MNLEIIEFYPTERNDMKEILNGTIRIKLPDLGIHILGIFLTKRKNTYFFNMPSKFGYDEKIGKEVRYPTFVFDDREKQRQFMEAIKIKGRAFIENWLKDSKYRKDVPSVDAKYIASSESQGICKTSTEAKETTYTPKLLPLVTDREYKTPPPIKKRAMAGAKAKR